MMMKFLTLFLFLMALEPLDNFFGSHVKYLS